MAHQQLGNGQHTEHETDIAVVTPRNMGKGTKWNPEAEQYELNVSAPNHRTGSGLTITEQGQLMVSVDRDPTNLLQLKPSGLYYGTKPPDNLENLYVDAIHGVDADPNQVEGAGTRDKPLRTIKFADSLAAPGTYRNIFLRENQEHLITKELRTAIKDGVLNINPYGDILDDYHRQDVDGENHLFKLVQNGFAPKLVFKGIDAFDNPSGTENWVKFTMLTIGKGGKVIFNGITLVNDKSHHFSENGKPWHIKQYERIYCEGELMITRSSLEDRGEITFDESITTLSSLQDQKSHHLSPNGFISGYSAKINLYRLAKPVSCRCYIFTEPGWNTKSSAQTIVDCTFDSASNENLVEVARRIAGFRFDDLGNGVSVIRIPTTNIPTAIWKQI